jgi:xanthine dehydrogenase small subunit
VAEAADVLDDEIAPISDIRGSADYKRLLARRLLIASLATLYPEEIPVEAFV